MANEILNAAIDAERTFKCKWPKVDENSLPFSITHRDDFRKYFPDIDLSPPERSV